MKRHLNLMTALLLVSGLALTGCFEDPVGVYNQDPQVEFAQVSGRYSAAVAEGAGTVALTVNLIGPQRSTDTVVDFMVGEGTTAVEGTHYSFPNGMQVTIPANSSFGDLEVNVLPNSLDAGASGALELVLEDSQDGAVKAAPNLGTFTLTIVGQ